MRRPPPLRQLAPRGARAARVWTHPDGLQSGPAWLASNFGGPAGSDGFVPLITKLVEKVLMAVLTAVAEVILGESTKKKR